MKNFLTFSVLLLSLNLAGQSDSKLVIDIQFADYNYLKHSAKTYSSSYLTPNPAFLDYIKAYNSPSMQQSLAISASFHNGINYAFSRLDINWFNNEMWNYFMESTFILTAEILSTYIPLGDAWLHEEFHRAVLTNNFVKSYDQVNDIPLFSELISVNNVVDEHLINFKKNNPQDFVRLHSAGIEGEYMLTHKLQSYNLFYDQKLPYYTYTLIWTINSFYYVWFCHTENAEQTTNELNITEGSDIPIRDFTGLDFLAWTYDLYAPFEDYESRGTHASGVGIDRYIKPSDLTDEQLKFLKKEGFLQLINFGSPMLLGINRILFNTEKNSYFNFATRHLLTSFGHDISAYFFYKQNKLNLILGLHIYQNQNKTMPGIELEVVDYDFKLNNITFRPSIKSLIWFQPENLLFADTKSDLGGLVDLKIKGGKGKIFPYVSLTAKTKGWVAGYENQTKKITFRAGLSLYLF